MILQTLPVLITSGDLLPGGGEAGTVAAGLANNC